MGSLITTKISSTGEYMIDVVELSLRLTSIKDGCSLEVVRLAISSMLDEISDVIDITQENSEKQKYV